jgi:hypothetical protein
MRVSFSLTYSAWPKASEYISDNTSKYLSLMAIELDDAFEEALEFLWPFIKPFSDLSFLITNLNSKDLPDQQPKTTFRILTKVFKSDYQWPYYKFRDVLNRIVQADPTIIDEPGYRNMNDFLVQHGH